MAGVRAVAAAAGALLAVIASALALLAAGALHLDLGVGRRLRPLGPITVRIDAPRERVFDVIAVPYLAAHPPRALREKIEVLERGTDMVVAAHRTRVGRITSVTVEAVSFERPNTVRFRLLRGPVPLVDERFVLRDADGGATDLEYSGSLGTDLWGIGAWWGGIVAARWERVVADSLDSLKGTAEETARRERARSEPSPAT